MGRPLHGQQVSRDKVEHLRVAKILVDSSVGEHGLDTLEKLAIVPAEEKAAILVGKAFLVLGAGPAPCVFETHSVCGCKTDFFD